MPFFSGHLVEVLRSVWWMRVYYVVGGWVGQAYIISLAPHPGGQQQKVPFTTECTRAVAYFWLFLLLLLLTPSP